MNELEKWLATNRIGYRAPAPYNIIIDNKSYFVIEGEDGIIMDENFHLTIGNQDVVNMDLVEGDIEGFIFKFGTKWYYTESSEKIELTELRYIGTEAEVVETFPMLGVHGGFDLMNGSRSYKDWCKKAKFCNIASLGLCEENTLAGTLEFQNACEKANIKSIIGETVIVKGEDGVSYSIKLYVQNQMGWKNLLMINACINVHNEERFITEDQLINFVDGLACILTPEVKLKDKFPIYDIMFSSLYYQIDVPQWDSLQRDNEWLEAIDLYIKEYSSKIKPILITDAYYLEKEHAGLKKELNAIGKVSFKNQSGDQFFKTPTQQLSQLLGLFNEADDDKACEFIYKAIDNTKAVGDYNFKIETGKLNLPAYKMTEAEKNMFKDKDDLLWSLLERGLIDKGLDSDEVVDRIETEMKVICDAKLQDYFLITWDILNWAHENGIMTGYGRGSAAGSIVAYLLGIVQVNPLDYDLLFERFLNEGRLYKKKKVNGWEVTDDEGSVSEWDYYPADADAMGFKIIEKEIEIKVTGSMPDIDNDIAGSRREELKRYIEQRYGVQHVAGIGTYSALKIKSALKDLAKRSGHQAGTMEYITAAIVDDSLSYAGLFRYALTKSKTIKDFIIQNPELIEKIPFILNQPKTPSVHAGGVIIVPDSENGIYEQIPVKKVDGILVSEWEMEYVEQAGFLKMDILGLKQLDKFTEMIELIKLHKGEDIVLNDILLDDPKVYEYFTKGYNEDVFQFGGGGLKGYTRDLQPTLIADLIATSALYRPGPIDMKAHLQYVERKNGGKVSYPYGTENILRETYGVLCYQEQVQQIVAHVAGFTPNESDDVRKAIGKKLPELMAKYRERFIEGAVDNGCPKDEATQMWEDIEGFGAYSFNKSHATCYSIMGYFCQWIKVHFPLEFWLVCLKHSSSDQIINRLAEMSLIGGMEVGGPNINHSTDSFTTDGKKIFWSLQSVKQVGEKALIAILEERKNGEFYSVTEFYTRLSKTAVNRATIINLILTGAFDELHNIDDEKLVRNRYAILQEFVNDTPIKSTDEQKEDILKMQKWENYQWILKQRELCGLGMVNIKTLLKKVECEEQRGVKTYTFYSIAEAIAKNEDEFSKKGPILGGIITKIDEKKNKSKPDQPPFALIEISDGVAMISGVMWSEEYAKYKDSMNINDLLFMRDVWIKYDDRYKKSNTFTVTKHTRVAVLNQ